MSQKPSVFIAVLTLAERDGWCAPGLVAFIAAMKLESGVRIAFQHNIRPWQYARNGIAKMFLDSGCEWLLMLDNDMAPPLNLLGMLDRADDRMDILVPQQFCITDAGLTLGWKFRPGEDGTTESEWVELEGAGSGAMFIRRRVFEPLSWPYFDFVLDESKGLVCGEDLYLCHKARAAGFRVWGNKRFEVDHFKTVSLNAMVRLIAKFGAPLALDGHPAGPRRAPT